MALAVDAVDVSDEWIRHAPHHSDLLGRAAEPTDGRWRRREIVRGLYLAEEPATAVAEWYRWLAERGLPPAYAIPHDHQVWKLDLELADLRSTRRLAALGLDLPSPGRRTWRPYQEVGETLWREGWPGLLTRSAAGLRRSSPASSRRSGRQTAARRSARSSPPESRSHRPE